MRGRTWNPDRAATTGGRQTGSDELFSIDERGRKVDAALHDPILDNPAAEALAARQAMASAIEMGMSPEDAEAVFGVGSG